MNDTLKTPDADNMSYNPQNRLLMIVGNYGSGKTEVAVNLALHLRRSDRGVHIADLDVVNPYFRCREPKELMQAAGIRVVVPPGIKQYADLPIVVPEIRGMVQSDDTSSHYSIFDVGGDDVGATILSSLVEPLGERPYSLLQVINSRRPFTDTVKGCLDMKASIEKTSRLSVTGLIVNSHLIEETTRDVILEGYELASDVSGQCGVPIEFVTAMGPLADDPAVRAVPVPILKLERVMLPPWLEHQTIGTAVKWDDTPPVVAF
jgi:hypothetical protein